MFSYLHGIRPNNRRSVVPQAAAFPQNTTSQYYHEGPPPSQGPSTFTLDPPRPRTSQANSLNGSPVSPNPPILPPIPRVASQRESERVEEMDVWTRREGPAPSELQKHPQQQAPTVSPIPVPSNSYSTSMAPKDPPYRTSGGFVTKQSPFHPNQNQPQAATGRPRRPIDAAYESMRSYSEPLHRQSLEIQQANRPFLPEPSRRPPPPPPKPSHHEAEPQRQAPPPPGKVPQQAQPTASQNRHSKARLNLLNPMSLLARRRSSQAVEEAHSQNQTTSGMRLPDDYDPRIRGKVIHDFSAPRPGRKNSSSESSIPTAQTKEKRGSLEISQKKISPNPGSSFPEDESPSSTEREHTPVFKENFEDNVQPWRDDLDSPAKRRTSAFVYKMSLQESQPEPDPSSLPAFARALPPKVPPKDVQTIASSIDAIRKASSPSPRPPLEKVLEDPLPNQESAKPFPAMSPPKARSRSTSLSDPNFDGPGSPRRYKSNASRFSFDLAGVGSAAQEQLLEEGHRQQKAKRKQRESVLSDGNETYDEDEYADYDDMDDDGGLEEKIPGVNADDEDFEMPLIQKGTEMSFISPNKSSFDSASSPVSTGLTSPGTPHDSQSQPNGFVISNPSPKLARRHLEVSQISLKENSSRPKSVPGVGSDPGFDVQSLPREIASESNLAGLPSRYDCQDDDDMYFDDGMIEDIDDGENQGFDESVFDDDTSKVFGLPLRDLKPLPTPLQNPDNLMISQVNGQETHVARQFSSDYDARNPTLPEPPEDDATAAELMDSVTDLKRPTRGSFSEAAGLTQDNLGLHDQLAMAANQAELAGRFQRSYSLASTYESKDGFDPSAQMRPYKDHMALPVNNFSGPGMGGDAEDFAFDDADIGFDDEEADDTIIAAANAEALENDDDGFYGQEFGFFARASGSSESEYVHGGYFGARALEGIHRMNSGRENKDPSLTPITERSEWSNRNSAISLAMHGYPLSAQYPSTPQLASLMNLPEDDMSLEALQKLRRGAWGGSNGSLRSSNNSQNSGSPLTYLPPGMIVPSLLPQANSNGHIVNSSNQNLAGSFHSFSSSNGHPSSAESDPSPLLESPTITLSTSQPGLYIQHPMGPPPPQPADNTSPIRKSAVIGKSPWAPSHSRNSSGAESVSYREEGGKWVCEKRRVDATGEIEVLGRSVVEGGRI
ncbi:MAG: hypothetical protein Q9161_005996 [Pseudevernia consocians]